MKGRVRIKFRPALAKSLGLKVENMVFEKSFRAGDRLSDVLELLARENNEIARRVYDPRERRVNSLVQISINGCLLPLAGGVETPLTDRDEVLIFYAAGGG